MSGLGSTLHIAKDALRTQQYGLAVTGNNIANVNNPDYSRQTIEQINKGPLKYGGFLFGTGVSSSQVSQSVNQLLENRLTGEKSNLAGYEEAEFYVRIIEGHFDESSDNSISGILGSFWNSWNDLSNNPADDSERLIVLENGRDISERLTMAYNYLGQVDVEISNKMLNAVDTINKITTDIAKLNKDIMGQETQRTSNDKRDQRNALLDELGKLIDVDIFEQPSGAVVANVANGFPVVNAHTSYDLDVRNNEIFWINSAGKSQNISDKITGGQMGGWMDMREEIIPKYKAELDEFAHEIIWAVNLQHSRGAGLEYHSDTLTGTYAVNEGGWLTSLPFGGKIDHSENFTMWIEDRNEPDTRYSKIEMDMGISEASLSNWQAGTDLPVEKAVYKLTVLDGTNVGDTVVSQTNGSRLATPVAGTGMTAAALMRSTASPIAEQTLIIGGGPSGKETMEIKYSGGDAKQSAASIAQALSSIEGVTAHASENSALLDISTLAGPAPAGASSVRFGIYVDGITHYETFDIDPSQGEFQEQFEDALVAAVDSLNNIYGDKDLRLEYDVSDALEDQFRLISTSGRTIGVEGFEIQDAAGTAIVPPIPAPPYSIAFSGSYTPSVPGDVVLVGTGAGTEQSAVVTGTITIESDPGISISSTIDGASGGLFSGRRAQFASSILTLGGEGGYNGFANVISFDMDGIGVSYDVNNDPPAPNPHTTDIDFARGLEAAINTALPPTTPGTEPLYTVIRNGASVSILKSKESEEPITIENFSQTPPAGTPAAGARLALKTGTGRDTSPPDNDLLNAGDPLKNSAVSSLYEDNGTILWEKYDTDGFFTGEKGLITVEDAENITIADKAGQELLTFDIAPGSLVAGNTMSMNINRITDASGNDLGVPDPLKFTIRDNANSQNSIYQFKVVSGGTVGILPGEKESPIKIEWDNGVNSGTFEIEDTDPPKTPHIPVEIEVDGMTLMFTSGTLFKGDVFTVTTDAGGRPVSTNDEGDATGEFMYDWHWTLESFADQFNRKGEGMTASVNTDNQLVLSKSDNYHVMGNIKYSGENGFTRDNIKMEMTDWSAMDFASSTLQFSRNQDGHWSIINDPTGGQALLMPLGGDDDSFGVDFSGDGLADMTVSFTEKPSGPGYISLDLEKRHSENIGFAFSDASGMMAAAGINTFFQGDGAQTVSVNQVVADSGLLAAATIDHRTGLIDQGDNSNTLAMADIQFKSMNMKQWYFSRGEEPRSSMTTATLGGYYTTMLGSLGVDARNIQSSREFSSLMVNYITEERNSVSAVSLDEEMIKLIEHQQAFNAASKLVKVTDEMLNTLIGLR
ncbi:MAG: flagellar hook-associated protein FlgK [Desulfamplus sp.]|nr:flagellar hook-associated protein FlgK [Desulfamplus sp.]